MISLLSPKSYRGKRVILASYINCPANEDQEYHGHEWMRRFFFLFSVDTFNFFLSVLKETLWAPLAEF